MTLSLTRSSDLTLCRAYLPPERFNGGAPSLPDREGVQASAALEKLIDYLHTWNPRGLAPELEIIIQCMKSYGLDLVPFIEQLAAQLPQMHMREIAVIRRGLLAEANSLRIHGYNCAAEPATSESRQFDYILNEITVPQRRNSGAPLSIPTLNQIQSLSEGGEISLDIPIVEREDNPRPFAPKIIESALIDPARYGAALGVEVDSDTSEDLGVYWDRTKFIRDILQNFLDGHGQTLEGTKLVVKREGDRFVIRIVGKGEYDPEKAIKYGGSGKQDGTGNSAGKHGEGLKVIALIGLRDHGCDQVSFSSRNWLLEYTMGEFAVGIKGLKRKLVQVDDLPGNFVEIRTGDAKLVSEIFDGVNLVYHPDNPDFSGADIENDVGGFKIHGLDDVGNLYVARQRVQVQDGYDRANWDSPSRLISVWTQTDPNPGNFDRERAPLNLIGPNDISRAIPRIVDEMRPQQLLEVLKKLEPFWGEMLSEGGKFCTLEEHGFKVHSPYVIADQILVAVCKKMKSLKIRVQFDPKYRFVSRFSWPFSKTVASCRQSGLIPCPLYFEDLGMEQFVKPQSDSKLSSPISEGVPQKLAILNRACKLLELPLFVKRGGHDDLDEYCPISVNDCALSEEDALRSELVWGNDRDTDPYLKIHISRAIFDLPLDQVLGMCWLRAPKWSEPGKIIDLKDCLGGDEQRQIRDLAYLWNALDRDLSEYEGSLEPSGTVVGAGDCAELTHLLSRAYGGVNKVPADLLRVVEVIGQQVEVSKSELLIRLVGDINGALNDRMNRTRAAIENALRPWEPGDECAVQTSGENATPFRLFKSDSNHIGGSMVSHRDASWNEVLSIALDVQPRVGEMIPAIDDLSKLTNGESLSVKIPVVDGSSYKPRRSATALVDLSESKWRQLSVGQQVETDLLVSYGVRWSFERVIRDLYQNFLDGQGHTLEGIEIKVEPTGDGGCKLTVYGDGEYDLTKAVYLGQSESRDDQDAAGKHGEGLKIIALQLLRDNPSIMQIAYSSRNWMVDYTLGEFSASGSTGLKRRVTAVEDRSGNFMELRFQYVNESLIHAILSGIDLAYFPQHPDFSGMVYRSDAGGIKVLNPEDKGRLYLAGQRYSTSRDDGDPELWSGGFHGFVIWWNTDLRRAQFARERGPFALGSHGASVGDLFDRLLKGLTVDQCISLLKDFEPFWSTCWDERFTCKDGCRVVLRPEYKALGFMMYLLVAHLRNEGVRFSFPDNYVASARPEEDLTALGYRCCSQWLEEVGMRSASDARQKLGQLAPIVPNEFQVAKLGLLKIGLEEFLRRSPDVFHDALVKLNEISQWGVGRQELFDYNVTAKFDRFFDSKSGQHERRILIREGVLSEKFGRALLRLIEELGADYSDLLENSPALFAQYVLRGSNESAWFRRLKRIWNRTGRAEKQQAARATDSLP